MRPCLRITKQRRVYHRLVRSVGGGHPWRRSKAPPPQKGRA